MLLLIVIAGSAALVLFASGLPGFASRAADRRISPYLPAAWDGSFTYDGSLRSSALVWLTDTLFLEEGWITADRLLAAGSTKSVHRFRLERLIVGLASGVSLGCFLVALGGGGSGATVLAALLGGASASGVWDRSLSRQAERRGRRMVARLPLALDLLSIAVRSGESVEASIRRVAACLGGTDLGSEFDRVSAEIRSGTPTVEALQKFAALSSDQRLQRAGRALALAIENGTPVADVLNGQASDVREAERRALLEAGGKREVWMLIPVVFLLLPTMVLLVFYPSLVSLDMFVP